MTCVNIRIGSLLHLRELQPAVVNTIGTLKCAARQDGAEGRRIIGVGCEIVNGWKGAAREPVLRRHIDEGCAQCEGNEQHGESGQAELGPPSREHQDGKDDGDC